jgi:hypothetical protein
MSVVMAEVLVEFDTTVPGSDGTRWAPRVCGRIAADGLWEGWIEFTPNHDDVEPIRTPRETEQPNRDDLMYWAQGLTQVYLEDALRRALEPSPPARLARAAPPPHFEGPAPRARHVTAATPHPILNPYDVYLQGEDILVRELSALSEGRVRDIAVAFGLVTPTVASELNRDELSATILAGVRHRAMPNPEHRQDLSS